MFRCTIQKAGYAFDKMDDAGTVLLSSFLDMLDKFPWLQELEKANEMKGFASPTLSVTNESDDRTLWVSIFGNPEKYHFLIGYVHLKEKKGLFGLGKKELKKWVDMYTIKDLAAAKHYFSLFFGSSYPQLEEELGLEKLYDSSPSKI